MNPPPRRRCRLKLTMPIADVLTEVGSLRRDQGAYTQATGLLEEGLALLRDTGERNHTSELLLHLGETALMQGDDARARAWEEASLRLKREFGGNSRGIAWPLINLGYIALHASDLARARACFTQSLALLQGFDYH